MTRKERVNLSSEQKLEYAKMMHKNGYSNKQIMEISGAGATAVRRWKKQYQEELRGITPEGKKALTAEQQRIQALEKQLKRARKDNEILKKADPVQTISEICSALEVPDSSYYYHIKEKPLNIAISGFYTGDL